MDGLLHDLEKRIAGDVRFDDVSRMMYSTDASIYQIEPIGVVIPRDAHTLDPSCYAHGYRGLKVLE